MSFSDVNWLAVLVAGVVYMMMGAAWYSERMFCKRWLALIGKTADQLNPKPTIFIAAFASSVLTALFIAVIYASTGGNGLVDGVMVGFWTALGFALTSTLIYSLFEGP